METSVVNGNKENNISDMRRTPQQRKISYRNLLNRVEGLQETEDVGLNTVKDIGEVLREVNNLDNEWKIDERVEHADETLLDCMVLSSASNILKKCIEAVDVFTSTYEQSEFSNKIINSIKDDKNEELEPNDLLNLLEDARSIIPDIPKYRYVYGAYDLNNLPQPKPKKERQKVVKEKLQRKEPEKVTSVDKDEEGIEEIVKVLHDVLKEKYVQNNEEPIKYYDYIIDTDDFASTVENMFYFAFLIRDGRASIDLSFGFPDSRGEPIIKPARKKALKDFRDGGGVNAQIISTISYEHWQKFKKAGYLQQHRKEQSAQ
nr:non-structural maintenance of chromosomes element 4 homolog A-like isoform X1 [Leptinotarsa decemlineata]